MTVVVHRSLTAPALCVVEPAGAAHYRLVVSEVLGDQGPEAASEGVGSNAKSTKSNGGGNKKSEVYTSETIHGANFYERLGLDPLGISVGPEEVKRAYHKALLIYHPDKTGRGDEDEVFLAIQEAHDTLSDATRRKAYDSLNEFDDTIPSGNESGDFYEVYGPVFHSNGRFAVKVPVPSLGDDATPDDEVFEFYRYWEGFESWRDFSRSEDLEHDPEEADSREEKRWMIKENSKEVKQLKNKDNQRIIDLTQRAKLRDPRVKRFAERAKAEKQAARQAKHKAREALEAEEAQRKADLRAKEQELDAKKQAGAKAAKQEKERVKKAGRRIRSFLRRFASLVATQQVSGSAPKDLCFTELEVDLVCEHLGEDLQALQALLGAFGALGGGGGGGDESVNPNDATCTAAGLEAGAQAVHEALAKMRAAKEDEQARAKEARQARAAEAARKEEQVRQAKEAELKWDKDELSWLAKGAKKFPAGYHDTRAVLGLQGGLAVPFSTRRDGDFLARCWAGVEVSSCQRTCFTSRTLCNNFLSVHPSWRSCFGGRVVGTRSAGRQWRSTSTSRCETCPITPKRPKRPV